MLFKIFRKDKDEGEGFYEYDENEEISSEHKEETTDGGESEEENEILIDEETGKPIYLGEDGNYYFYTDEDEESKEEEPTESKKSVIFTVFMIALFTTAIIYIWLNLILPSKNIGSNTDILLDRTENFINLLYDVDNVETIITNHESVKRYLSESLFSKFDVTNTDVYLDRYEDFSNSKINITSLSLSLTEQSKDEKDITKNREIIAKYTLETGISVPNTRIAYIIYNEKGIIIDFEEYVSYTVVD